MATKKELELKLQEMEKENANLRGIARLNEAKAARQKSAVVATARPATKTAAKHEVIEEAKYSHDGPKSKSGNSQAVFYEGEKTGRNYQVWVPLRHAGSVLPTATIREYSDKAVMVTVGLIGGGNITKWLSKR